MTIKDEIREENEPTLDNDTQNDFKSENISSDGKLFDILKSKTGPGEIEEYIDHPINFKKSKAVAKILRGIEGIFGALDLAIIDILIGSLELIKNNRQKKAQNETS